MNNKLTIEEAVQWLLDNPSKWNKKVMSPQTVTMLRKRFRDGKMGDAAKMNLIERSGEFEKTIYFEFRFPS